MNTPEDPRRSGIKRPDENNHSTVEDDIPGEQKPAVDPRRQSPEEFPGKDDEPEPIPPPDEARG